MSDRYFMMRAMDNTGQKDYRPEQMKAKKILRQMISEKVADILLEQELRNLKPYQNLEIDFCKPDIIIRPKINPQGLCMAIRLMGPPHEKPHQRLKDDDQFWILLANGYLVVDFWYDKMTNLWKNGIREDDAKKANMRLATEEIIGELFE